MTAPNPMPRQPERRKLEPDQRTIYLQLQEYSHQTGAVSSGQQWIPLPRPLLTAAVRLIEQLRAVQE